MAWSKLIVWESKRQLQLIQIEVFQYTSHWKNHHYHRLSQIIVYARIKSAIATIPLLKYLICSSFQRLLAMSGMSCRLRTASCLWKVTILIHNLTVKRKNSLEWLFSTLVWMKLKSIQANNHTSVLSQIIIKSKLTTKTCFGQSVLRHEKYLLFFMPYYSCDSTVKFWYDSKLSRWAKRVIISDENDFFFFSKAVFLSQCLQLFNSFRGAL